MALTAEKGTFTKRSGTGSQTVTLADSSITPKVLWLWSTGVTSDATYAEHYSVAYGFSDGTNDACIGIDTEDNIGTSDCAHIFRNNAVISILDPSGGTAETIAGTADVTSFNAGNFILNWSASNTSAIIIHYMVAGGSDITNVKVTQHSIASTAGTGTESFTGVGFQGDFINIIAPYARSATGYDGTVNTAGADMGLLIGAATSSTARWFLGSIADDGSTSGNTFSIYETAQFLAGYNPLTQARAILANFSAFASDGFDLNLSQEDMTGGTLPFASLVIKGGLWNVGTGTAPASTGSQTINTTAGHYPYGVMFYTWGNTSTSSGTAPSGENRIAIGGTDYNLNEGCISVHDLANQTNYVNSKINLNSKLIRAITANATASSSTTVAEADISSMSSSGSFAVNWTTTLSGMNYVWFSVGSTTAPAVGQNFIRAPSTETITVTDASTTRTLSANRAPSTDSPAVTDSSLTRMLSATRVPSSDTLTIADVSTTRSATRVRSTSTDSSTITDSSLTRMLSATRAPSTDVLTIGDSRTRMLSALRLPPSDSITVADVSITRLRSLTRIGGPETTGVSDSSLTRLLSAIRVPALDTVTVTAGTSTRMLSAIRVPSLDTVASTEQVIGGKVYGRIPSTDSTTIADVTITRLLSAIRSRSDDVISGESLIRILSASRVTGSDSTTVADVSVLRLRSLTRVPSTDAATVVDSSLVRMLSASRSPSQDNISISDSSLQRILSALRLVTAETITVSENITSDQSQSILRTASDDIAVTDGTLSRFLSATRVPSSETVTVADSSLVRMLQLIRIVTPDTIALSENISSALTTAGVFSRTASDTVLVAEASLIRLLSSIRIPSTDTTTTSDNVLRSATRIRSTTTDNISIADVSITRSRSLTRLPTQDTMNIVEASLIRLLSLGRSISDNIGISEVQSEIAHARALLEAVNVSEPLLQRIVSASRTVNDIVDISEALFYQTYHKYVFDTVVVSEQLFKERTSLSGAVTYAIPSEVRPLLGNIGPTQRTDEQIELAIDAAYDEINTKTNRIPPNDWKDTDHNFGIVKKLARYIAAKEMAIGIKDFDTKPLEMEIEHLFNDLLTYDTTSDATQDIVGSSVDETYALNEGGLIWSTRYRNLRKPSGSENSTDTINPDT